MSLTPWRQIATPHEDVRNGTLQMAEFAADLSAVHDGKAPLSYRDPRAFFERTYITGGMSRLLTAVARRLNGQEGDPVLQLQTAFGGGKTHTLLAVYHLATHKGAASDLPGVPELLDRAGLTGLPRASVAVIDGLKLSPGQPWRRGRVTVKTLWGDLAWQLGGKPGYDLIAASDEAGVSPGRDLLQQLIERAAPCVILIDELVAFVRQLSRAKTLSAGDYNANLSFLQALTEAVKAVPNAALLASLPDSRVEAGDDDAQAALRALGKVFGRVQAVWQPVEAEESFQIVRRRLFQPIVNDHARDEVVQAFAELYRGEPARFPAETQEARYAERLRDAYPLHPEVFDRLYGDWSTLPQFQRTRGVLKLLAQVIQKLWADANQDLLIMPANLPLARGNTRSELVTLLGHQGWDAVLDRDVESLGAEAVQLDNRESRFGAGNATVRVARTVFLGSAPAATQARIQNRGVDRARVALGCVRPTESPTLYIDALSRLSDRAHYLNATDDRAKDTARYYFDLRANLRREMEDRRLRLDDDEVNGMIAKLLVQTTREKSPWFPFVHPFADHSDVRDDEDLHLVLLRPEHSYSAADDTAAEMALKFVMNHGARPRKRANRLLFLAADHNSVERLRDAVKTALAWRSIVEDNAAGRLVVDNPQQRGAEKEHKRADQVALTSVRDCYCWLLCPAQGDEHQPATIEAHKLNPSSSLNLCAEAERVCRDNELVIDSWAPIHLQSLLRRFYWRPEQPHVRAKTVWEDSLSALYLPRLRSRGTFEATLRRGAESQDWFATAGGLEDGRYLGFAWGAGGVALDDALLLIEPGEARRVRDEREAEEEERRRRTTPPPPGGTGPTPPPEGGSSGGGRVEPPGHGQTRKDDPPPTPPKQSPKLRFIGTADVNPTSAELELARLADEIISLLIRDPKAKVTVRVEIDAEFPNGVSETTRRAVSENAATLGLRGRDWE